jgi:hypothetical protein
MTATITLRLTGYDQKQQFKRVSDEVLWLFRDRCSVEATRN